MLSRLRAGFSLWPFLIGLGIAAVVAYGMRLVSGLPYWGCLAIVVTAMVVNGLLAEWEDNRPGGFNNPSPDDPSFPTQPRSNTDANGPL